MALSYEDKIRIKTMAASKLMSQAEIGKFFGVSEATVSKVVNGSDEVPVDHLATESLVKAIAAFYVNATKDDPPPKVVAKAADANAKPATDKDIADGISKALAGHGMKMKEGA